VKFRNNNQTYTAVLVRKEFASEGLRNGLAMFQILDGDGENVLGCISFSASLLSTITSDKISKDLFLGENSELILVSLLSQLPIDFEKLLELSEKGSWCLVYLFDSQVEDGYKEEERTYYLKVKDGLYKTAQRIIFHGQFTNKTIQIKILEILYANWEENPDTNVILAQLQAMIPVNTIALKRNLKSLEEDGEIKILYEPADATKIVSVQITGKGRRKVDGESEITRSHSIEYVNEKIMGDKISALSTGKNSPVVVKSSNITIDYKQIDKLEYEVENKYTGEDKADLIQKVEEIKSLANKPSDYPKIRKILGELLTRTSETATIGSAIFQVLKMFQV